MHVVSIQTADWYDILFNGDENSQAAFQFIKDCGFAAVDHNLDHTLSVKQIEARERPALFEKTRAEILEEHRHLKEAAEKTGVAIGQAHAPFPTYVEGDPEYNAYLVHVFEELLHVCAYIGCPALVIHPVKIEDKRLQWDLKIELYTKLIPTAKETGVKICLENLNDRRGDHAIQGVCGNGEEACRYIDTLNELAGEEVFGFCLDVGHANMASQNIRQMINILGHRITVLHIHDNDGVYDRHLIPYTYKDAARTSTSLDWEGLLEGLKDIGYQGALNFETFAALKAMPQELFEPTLRYVAAIGRYFQNRLA